jgi:hypothetical protein
MTKILDNIILFPGKENNQLIEIEQKLLLVQKKLKEQMSKPNFDVLIISEKDLDTLANYGDIMFFDSFTARRLISILSRTIIEQRNDIWGESEEDA